jgi:hypothetical protein
MQIFAYSTVSMSVNLRVWNLELLWSPVLVPEFHIFTSGSAEPDLNGWQVSFPPTFLLLCQFTLSSVKLCLSSCELACLHGLSFKQSIYLMLPKSVVLYWKLSSITSRLLGCCICLLLAFHKIRHETLKQILKFVSFVGPTNHEHHHTTDTVPQRIFLVISVTKYAA